MGQGQFATRGFAPVANFEPPSSQFQLRGFAAEAKADGEQGDEQQEKTTPESHLTAPLAHIPPSPSESDLTTPLTVQSRKDESLQLQPTPTSQSRMAAQAGSLIDIPLWPSSAEQGTASTPATPIQAKLTIGQPGDKYEQEADRTAAQVMAMPDPGGLIRAVDQTADPTGGQPHTLLERSLQRVEMPTLDEEESLQTKPQIQAKEDDDALQRVETPNLDEDESLQTKPQIQAKGDTLQAPENFDAQLNRHKGGGQPLSPETRAFMEPRFGADFSGVRVHEASQEAGAIRAQAFTHGQDIYFNAGKYNPGSSSGKELLAHELTHTIQQTGGVQAKVSSELDPTKKANKETLQTKAIANFTPLPTVQRREAPAQSAENGAAPATPASAAPAAAPQAASAPANQPAPAQQPAQGGGENAAPQTQPATGAPPAAGNTAGGDSGAAAAQPAMAPASGAAPAGGGASAPASPESDPGVRAVVAQSGTVATEKKQHDPAESEAQEAQDAAESPASEVDSQAQDQQVADMEQQEPGEFDGAAFKNEILNQLAGITPNNEDEAADFKGNNGIDSVTESVSGQIDDEQEQAASPIEEKAEEEPDTSGIEPRQSTPMVEPDVGTMATGIDGTQAAPKPKSDSEVSAPLQANSQSLDQQMAEANITEEQLANSNEPEFMGALAAKDEAQTDAATSPGVYRAQEGGILTQAQGQAQATVTNQMQGMHGQREQLLAQVTGLQDTTKGQDEQKRTEIADHINGIYERVKTEVDTSLDGLTTEVTTKFETAANQGKQAFENYVDRKMTAYKNERYGEGLGQLNLGKLGNRGRDVFMGLPDEVNMFFVEGREKFIEAMDGPLTEISDLVANRLNEAKAKISQGRQEIQEYVQSLPEDLQQVGQEAAQSVQTKFDELEQSVDAKKDELVSTIVQKYQENLQAVDARIEAMKEQNKGLVDKAKDFLGGTIQKVLELKAMLEGALSGAAGAMENIIKDPIGFLNNLVSGISQGLNNFLTNIGEHLQGGLVGWLTGALGPMGITIPEDIFSLPGIFDLVTQVLGLTWNYIRGKAVKMFGDPVVSAMETGLETIQAVKERGAQGLWEEVQEDFADLKETVIDQIKNMVITQVITGGIKWILSLLNPASAFVKACMAIYDIVMFFINQGSQVLELVNAIVESIAAIASGAVGGAAALVEQALVKALPVAIGFLASLLGIGGLAKKVQGIIKNIRKRIDKAIDKLLKKAKKLFKKKKGNKEEVKDPDHDKKVKAGLDDIDKEEQKYLDKGEISEEDARKVASYVKQKYPVFKSITVIDGGDRWDYKYVASPPETKKGEHKQENSEKHDQLIATASSKELKPIHLNGNLIGKGREELEGIVEKINRQATHLTASDLSGAAKDILGNPVTINGKQFDHIGEVRDALRGLGNQLHNLKSKIERNEFEGDVLEEANRLLSHLSSHKDQIQNVLRKVESER